MEIDRLFSPKLVLCPWPCRGVKDGRVELDEQAMCLLTNHLPLTLPETNIAPKNDGFQ